MDLSKFGIVKEPGKYERDVVYSLALLYNAVSSELETYFQPYDLTVGKFNTLMAIRNHGGVDGIKQVEVSQHLIVTPSNMTKMIDKLSREGFVTRSPLEGDRRVNLLKITKKGEGLIEKVWSGYLNVIEKAVSGLTKSKQQQLAGLMGEWLVSKG